jgi:hypothetical protein
MKIAEGIWTIQNVLAEAECQEYISLAEVSGFTSAPITTMGGFEMRPDIRNNTRVILDDHDRARDLWRRVRDHIPPVLEGRQALGLNERFRFYRYDVGQYFAPHYDGFHRRIDGEQSLLTFMIYLNENFEGGETNFGVIVVRPVTGMALLFEHPLLHQGVAVRAGRKYVLRSDVMFGQVGRFTSDLR